jgi:acyl dehydratase
MMPNVELWGNALHQGPVVAALGRMAVKLAVSQVGPARRARTPLTVPGPWLTETVPARDPKLLRSYIRWCRSDPSSWRGTVPAHLFPQWGFPLLMRALEGTPWPLARALNAGCRIESLQPLPAGEPLTLEARLLHIDEDDRRALARLELRTRTPSAPDALRCELRVLVPTGKPGAGKRGGEAKHLVPTTAREIGYMKIGPDAGLEFACLTGDFNPVHWIRPWGRAAGFGGTILHGFATLARAIERVNRNVFAGDVHALSMIDVRFTRPVRLPARLGVWYAPGELWVGEAPGAPANLVGTWTARSPLHE